MESRVRDSDRYSQVVGVIISPHLNGQMPWLQLSIELNASRRLWLHALFKFHHLQPFRTPTYHYARPPARTPSCLRTPTLKHIDR